MIQLVAMALFFYKASIPALLVLVASSYCEHTVFVHFHHCSNTTVMINNPAYARHSDELYQLYIIIGLLSITVCWAITSDNDFNPSAKKLSDHDCYLSRS